MSEPFLLKLTPQQLEFIKNALTPSIMVKITLSDGQKKEIEKFLGRPIKSTRIEISKNDVTREGYCPIGAHVD